MALLIGLQSGKELLVAEPGYVLTNTNTGQQMTVYQSVEGKRLITVFNDLVEFYDEVLTKEKVEGLDNMSSIKQLKECESDDVSVV